MAPLRSAFTALATTIKLAILWTDLVRARLTGDRVSSIEDALEIGRLRGEDGHLGEARRHFQKAGAEAEQLGDPYLQARSRQLLASVAIQDGEFEAARALLLSAMPVLKTGGDQRFTLDALLRLAFVEDKLGNEPASISAFDEAARIALSIGDIERAIWALGDCGGLAYRKQDYARAEPYWARALELSKRTRKRAHEAKYMYFLGVVRYRLNQRESARSLLAGSQMLYDHLGMHSLADKAAEDLATIDAEHPRGRLS